MLIVGRLTVLSGYSACVTLSYTFLPYTFLLGATTLVDSTATLAHALVFGALDRGSEHDLEQETRES